MLTFAHRPARWAVFALLMFAIPLSAATLHRGTWTKKGYAIAGTWEIVEEGGKRFVVLDAAFKTKKAPDLKIFLSPKAVADLDNRNAIDGAALVAPLQSAQGAQRLAIPPGIDLSKYRTIVLHCEKYSKLWGAAAL